MALKILKWVGISIGILLILGILFLTWFSLETSGTFMRMREQPKLMNELKEMYGDKSLYVEEYESNADGIFSVGSFDYTIKSDANASIKFVVEYKPNFVIPIGDSEKSIEGMDIVKMIYKSSKQSADKLFSIEDALAYEYVKVFPEIITIDDLEYSNTITEEYDYGAVDCYVYRIVVNNEVEKEHIINKIDEVLTEEGIKEYQINLMFVESNEFENLLNSLKYSVEIPKQTSFFSHKKVNKDINFYSYYSNIITSYERCALVKKAGHFYVEVDGDEFDVKSYLDGSYKDYYYRDRENYIKSEPKVEKTFEEKTNDVCHMVIENELGHYFDDNITFYSNPFYIDENTVGDLEYKLYGNNPASRCQIVIERYFENGESVLDLRSDYAVNFALAKVNRKIDKMLLEKLSDIIILPDYISGCVEVDDYENDLENKEYLKNPIEFQNKYGTDNAVAKWLVSEEKDRIETIKEIVSVLSDLGIDTYGVDILFVNEKEKEEQISLYENFDINEAKFMTIVENGNSFYLRKNGKNITISYEDVPSDTRIVKDLEDFYNEYK